jgi:hypothetical protein
MITRIKNMYAAGIKASDIEHKYKALLKSLQTK